MGSVFISTIMKCVIVYFLALFLTKIAGTKIIAQMNFFDFIMTVSMGSMIANAVIDKDAPINSEVIALIFFTLLTIVTSFFSIKSFSIKKILSSKPVILIKDGIIIDKNIRKLRITIDELMMKLREKDIFNLSDVEFAIMERDGKLSVLKKADKQPVTPYDMKIQVKSSGLLKDIILDGKIIEKNLATAGISKKWLEDNLKNSKIENVSDVFYAGIDDNKKLNISKRGNEEIASNNYGIE